VTDHQLTKADRNLKAAHEYFDLARTASSPFMCAYYQRVAQRYLSSEGELSTPERRGDTGLLDSGSSTTSGGT
jgi:hypothetical protein